MSGPRHRQPEPANGLETPAPKNTAVPSAASTAMRVGGPMEQRTEVPVESLLTEFTPEARLPKTRHYFFAGDIEVGTGKPGYRWAPGFSFINSETGNMTYPWVTKRDAQREARIDGCKAVFHATKESAIEAVRASSLAPETSKP